MRRDQPRLSVDDMSATYERRLRDRVEDLMSGSRRPSQREIGIFGGLLQTLAPRATMARGDGDHAAAERPVFAWWERRMRATLRLLDGWTAS
jgi:hypothetical protein